MTKRIDHSSENSFSRKGTKILSGHSDSIRNDHESVPAPKKTKLLGMTGSDEQLSETHTLEAMKESQPEQLEPVVGWLVVLEGAGRGAFLPISYGVSAIGRGTDQRICLNFGDDTISRDAHAYIAYDEETRLFHINHGGSANLVRLNGKPVLGMAEIKAKDRIRLGKTELVMVPFCGPDFDWMQPSDSPDKKSGGR